MALAGCLNDGGGGGSGSLFASVAGNPNVAADVQEISTQPDGVLSSLLQVNPSAVRSARDALPGRVTWGDFLNGFYFPPAAFSQDAVPERVVTGTYQTYIPGHTWIRAGLGVARGDVNETALRDSLEVGDEGRSTHRGYDLLEGDREDSFAIGDDVLIGAGATYFMDQDESSPATPETLKAALLRGCVDRVED